jgi:hypothetical protein
VDLINYIRKLNLKQRLLSSSHSEEKVGLRDRDEEIPEVLDRTSNKLTPCELHDWGDEKGNG